MFCFVFNTLGTTATHDGAVLEHGNPSRWKKWKVRGNNETSATGSAFSVQNAVVFYIHAYINTTLRYATAPKEHNEHVSFFTMASRAI